MAAPRRRLIRPATAPDPHRSRQQRRLQKLRDQIKREEAALARWRTRLKRAFNAVGKHLKCLNRLERQLAQMEDA
jgi:hypothetical protein